MKWLGSSTIICLCIAVALGTITCQKKQDLEPVYLCEGNLYDKSLNNIRACVEGEWQLLYYQGGISDVTVYTPDTYVTIRNDSIMTSEAGSSYISSKISWDKVSHDYYGYTYLLTFSRNGNFAGGWIVVRRSSDTLKLNDFGSDPFGYILIKKRN